MGLAGLAGLTMAACKKEFFNRPPEDKITLDNFYKTAAQVAASTNDLYGGPWFGWNLKAGWAITELAGGNGYTYSSDVVNFGNFSVTNSNLQLSSAWNSLFTVIAQANALINNLPNKVDPSVDMAVVNNALGEAHLMRALAYFHLVRIFGNVPIIENSLDYATDYQVNTNPVTDVYRFIVNDLKFAEANCVKMIRSGSSVAQGHVSSGSASALLAKVYLYMEDYANARTEAEKVISSGEFKLYGIDIPGKTFKDLFLTANNNNEESVIALQWAGGASLGLGNGQQASFAYESKITGTGDGYAVIIPTFNLEDIYDPADQRRKPTIMLPGDYYPEIDQASGGYTFPANASLPAAVKKYVVGTPADNGGIGAKQSTAIDQYMMRYAEVWLIEAEAVMAGASASTDPVALHAINVVRERAGLPDLTSIKRGYEVPNPALDLPNPPPNTPPTLYRDDILDERRREFAFENDYWFDLCRLDGFNSTTHPKAITIIKQQDRGGGATATNPPLRFGNGYISNITDADFLFPYPATEVASDPKLLDPPVPYVFHQ
jgi:hypothetical protein